MNRSIAPLRPAPRSHRFMPPPGKAGRRIAAPMERTASPGRSSKLKESGLEQRPATPLLCWFLLVFKPK
jgi:hypothetical protein